MLQPPSQPQTIVWDSDHPWYRQPCDQSDSDWQAFLAYVKQPLPRTEPRDNALANRCHWRNRAACYDNYVHCQYVDSLQAIIVEHARDVADSHIKLIDNGLELAGLELARLLDHAKKNPFPGAIKPNVLVRMVDAFIKLRLLIGGEATERIEIETIEQRLNALPEKQILLLHEVQKSLKEGKK